MATVTMTEPRAPRFFTGAPLRLSWGAVFGGVFVALGVWFLLLALGLAVGLSSVDPANPGSIRSASIGTGIWSVIASFFALFAGGVVAARTAGIVDRTTGIIHGAVLWGFTTIISVVVLWNAMTAVLGTAVNVTTGVVSTAGSAVTSAAGGAPGALGLNFQDLVEPLNRELQQQGKPPVTEQQLQAATSDVINTAIAQGRVDRELLVQSIAENTNLSRAQARDLANQIEAQFNQTRQSLMGTAQGVGQDVQTALLRAADQTGDAMWWVFFGMLLGVGSSILGATLGVSRRQRVAAESVKDEQAPLGVREAHT